MTYNPDRVPVAASGDVYVAPLSDDPTLPEDATTDPTSPLAQAGYITEDGASLAIETESNDIPAWQSLQPIRSVVTGQTITTTFTLMEFREETLTLAFGGGTWNDDGVGNIDYTPPAPDERESFAAVIDAVDGDYTYRIVLPNCQVDDLGDITFQGGEATGLEVTLKALPDDSNVAMYVYINDASAGS